MGTITFSHPLVAVIHGAQSGLVRRVIACDPGETTVADYVDGESVILVDNADAAQALKDKPGDVISALQHHVVTKLGIPHPKARHAVVDAAGTVVACHALDPYIDKIDGHTLIQSDTLNTGDTLAGT